VVRSSAASDVYKRQATTSVAVRHLRAAEQVV
jgi:hypothetical protein